MTAARPLNARPSAGTSLVESTLRVARIATAAAAHTATIATTTPTTGQLGNEIEPKPDRPAHTKKTSMSPMCTAKPAAALSPTLDAATGASTPDFRK